MYELHRIKVVVSCDEKDKSVSHFNELIALLDGLRHQGVILSAFSDIPPGDDRVKAYRKLVEESTIAVLFVSQIWLDSDFVRQEILPKAQERLLSGNLDVVPVLVSPCDIVELGWLTSRQCFPVPGQCIATNYEDEGSRRTLFQSIRNEVLRLAEYARTKDSHKEEEDFDSLFQIGRQLIQFGQPRLAREKLDTALQSIAGEQTKRAGNAHIEAGHCQRKMGAQLAAFQSYETALAIGLKIEDNALKSHAYNCIGNIYREQGRLERAVEKYKQSLELLSQNEEAKWNVNVNLGATLRRIGDFDLAKKYIEKSVNGLQYLTQQEVDKDNKKRLRRGIGIALGMLSLCYVSANQLDEAKKCADQGLEIALVYDNPRGIGFAKHRVAKVLLKKQLYIEAVKLLHESHESAQEAEDTRQSFAVLLDLGKCYVKMNRNEDAERYYFSAMMHGVVTSDLFRIAQSHEYVGELRSYRPEEAFYYFEVARRLYQLVGARTWAQNVSQHLEKTRTDIDNNTALEIIKRTCLYIEETINKNVATRCHFTSEELMEGITE